MGSRIGNVVYSSGIGVRNPDGGSAPTPEVLVHAVAAVPNGLGLSAVQGRAGGPKR